MYKNTNGKVVVAVKDSIVNDCANSVHMSVLSSRLQFQLF